MRNVAYCRSSLIFNKKTYFKISRQSEIPRNKLRRGNLSHIDCCFQLYNIAHESILKNYAI